MDRLELGVRGRRLKRRREIVAVDERDEVVEKLVDELGWRCDELGIRGLKPRPPTQFCSSRTTPACWRSRVASRSVPWISIRSS
jgi:hypothetical protein